MAFEMVERKREKKEKEREGERVELSRDFVNICSCCRVKFRDEEFILK